MAVLSRAHSLIAAAVAAYFAIALWKDTSSTWSIAGAAAIGFAAGEFVTYVARQWWKDETADEP